MSTIDHPLPWRVRFGGDLDRCGRPPVGRWMFDAGGGHYEASVCEGCRDSGEFSGGWTFEPSPGGAWIACECACGHIAGARLADMDRTSRHLRCPACVEARHPADERTPASFASDPRVIRPR